MNAYTIIDQATWKRATHCAVFRNCVELPFSVQAHHSFVDGLHIGRLAEKLQNVLNNE